MEKTKIATVWLDGCSGCHMSFLDIDEHLIELDAVAQIVWSPLVDTKEFPPDVVVTLVEGAVSSEEDYHKIKMIRERTQILVSLGDCAVTANVPGMRNQFKTKDVLDRAYMENADLNQHIPLKCHPAAARAVGAGAPGSAGGCVCTRSAPRRRTRSGTP